MIKKSTFAIFFKIFFPIALVLMPFTIGYFTWAVTETQPMFLSILLFTAWSLWIFYCIVCTIEQVKPTYQAVAAPEALVQWWYFNKKDAKEIGGTLRIRLKGWDRVSYYHKNKHYSFIAVVDSNNRIWLEKSNKTRHFDSPSLQECLYRIARCHSAWTRINRLRDATFNEQKIFHGGCQNCLQQQIHGDDYEQFCHRCQYYTADWSKPDLSLKNIPEDTGDPELDTAFRSLVDVVKANDVPIVTQTQQRNQAALIARRQRIETLNKLNEEIIYELTKKTQETLDTKNEDKEKEKFEKFNAIIDDGEKGVSFK